MEDKMKKTKKGATARQTKEAAVASRWGHYRVLRAIEDTSGGVWLEICDGTRSAYVPRADFVGDCTTAFKRLERQGIAVLNRECQGYIRNKAQAVTNCDEKAIIVLRPGWCGPSYIMPDKTVVRPPAVVSDEVIVQFDANPKCKRSPGGLKDYVKAYQPIVKGQSLPITSILLSLAATLLDVVESTEWSVGNTGFDLVGEHNSGKTQNLAAAGATWGDDPSVKRGYADAWSGTLAATMARVQRWHDGFGGFDETSTSTLKSANKAGTATDLATKVMMLSDGAERNRYGDLAETQASRFFYLSTGNSAIVDAIDGRQEVIDAHSSRLITLRLELLSGNGIFDFVPHGFPTAAKAGNALDVARKKHHGWLALEFTKKLVEARTANESALVKCVGSYMDEYLAGVRDNAGVMPMDRIWRPLALAYAAGRLAKKWQLLPNSWGNFFQATARIYELATRSFSANAPATQLADPLDTLRAYLKNASLVDIRKKKFTKSKKEVENAPGFLSKNKHGHLEVLISAKQFGRVIPNCATVLATLKNAQKLAFEKDKTVVYRSIRGSGAGERDHVYAIRVRRARNEGGDWETRLT